MARAPRYNPVQRAVLANRNKLIMREDRIDAEVDRLLKPVLTEWEVTIRRTLATRAKDLTPAQLTEALRRTSTLNQLRAVSAQYIKAVERAVQATVRDVFRSEAYRAAHAASLGPKPGAVSIGFGGVDRAAVLAASKSPILTAKVARDFSQAAAASVLSLRKDLVKAVADGWNLSDLTEKWSGGAGAGQLLTRARTIARTAMMAASNEGHLAVWRAEGYQQVQWESSFDARVCPRCGSLHGQIFDIDKVPPIPAHFGCRCVILPYLSKDAQQVLGKLAPYRGDGPGADAGRTRSYEAWLRKQPTGVQTDVLGSEIKYRAWRDGDLTLAQLSNPDATTLTDAQVSRILGRAAAPVPAAPAHETSLAPEIKGRTNRELADSFSGLKAPDAYDGPTIGEGIRARMAKELRADLKAARTSDLAAIEADMNSIAQKMDEINSSFAGRAANAEEDAALTKLADELDRLLGERSIAEGGVPRRLQSKFHDLVRLPGRGRGLVIETDINPTLPGDVSSEQMAAIRSRVNVTTDLISKRVSNRPFYLDETGYTPKEVKGVVKTVVVPGNYRANYDYNPRIMRLSEHDSYRTIAHELGHHLEASNSRVRDAAVRYLERRTAGEAAQRLADLHPGLGYEQREMVRPDKFIGPYWGKDYGRAYTEIVSMGLEYIIEEPWTFARRDPETFDFVMAVLRGDYAEMDRIADGVSARIAEQASKARMGIPLRG